MADSSVTQYDLHVEDCLLVLASMPDDSVDSIVTDPPYLISFMGKGWDSADGIAGQPDVWRECLRVLKPGGHLLAFGATRTYHRMTVAIEDAGFEIRDSIHWTYGSGFPKSLNVGKALEAQAKTGSSSPKGQRLAAMGDDYTPTPLAGTPGYGVTGNFSNPETGNPGLEVTTPDAARWQGWGTALKPSHEPIVVARKPLAGTVAQTVLAYGTGALNIDGTRVGTDDTRSVASPTALGQGSGWNAHNNRPVVAGSASGRWPANTVLTHAADCQATGFVTDKMTGGFGNGGIGYGEGIGTSDSGKGVEWQQRTTSTPVFRCVPGCPVAELDQQSGERQAGAFPSKATANTGAHYEGGWGPVNNPTRKETDSGGASRFFTTTEWTDLDDLTPFLYVAKPSKRERNAGLDGLPEKPGPDGMRRNLQAGQSGGRGLDRQNFHPTVKPVTLMRHLVRLVTPPGGVVLDPFTGSGTTGVAAILEGFHFIGIEREAEYVPIVEARLTHAQAQADSCLPLTGGETK